MINLKEIAQQEFYEEVSKYEIEDFYSGDIMEMFDLESYKGLEEPAIFFKINNPNSVEVSLYDGEEDKTHLLEGKEELEKILLDCIEGEIGVTIDIFETEHNQKISDIKKIVCLNDGFSENGEQFCTKGKTYDVLRISTLRGNLYFVINNDNGGEHFFSIVEDEQGTSYKEWFKAV